MKHPAFLTRFLPTACWVRFVLLLAFATVAPARDYRWITLAGSNGGSGLNDGQGPEARFSGPDHIAIDTGDHVWIADTNNHAIRRIAPGGAVTTLAGYSGVAGSTDGTGRGAMFSSPRGIAVSMAGEIFVADTGNHTIRRITPDGATTTIGGLAGTAGSADGPTGISRFNAPRGLAFDNQQRLLVADTGNHSIRRIDLDGTVTTLAGLAGVAGTADGPVSSARFRSPRAIAANADGTIFIADTSNHTIRKLTIEGIISTVAGIGGLQGNTNGSTTTARFRLPNDVTVAPDGSLRVADQINASIRIIAADGTVSTLGGGGLSLALPAGIAFDSAGNLVVSQTGRSSISRINPALEITALAGSPSGSGSNDGLGTAARFLSPSGVSLANDSSVIVADTANHTIRRIDAAGNVTTVAGTAGVSGITNGPLAVALFKEPRAAVMSRDGTILVADTGNKWLRRILTNGAVDTLTGTTANLPVAERFIGISGIALKSNGDAILTDSNQIRRVTPTGAVFNLAGQPRLPVPASGTDILFWKGVTTGNGDGTGTSAFINNGESPCIAPDGSVWFVDQDVDTVRRLDTANRVITFAGEPHANGFSDGTGTAARFSGPKGVARDPDGNLVVVDTANHVIRLVDPLGDVTTIGGIPGYAGSGEGIGGGAQFRLPEGIAIDASGLIRVADTGNHRIVLGIPQPVTGPANRPPRFAGYALQTAIGRPLTISRRKVLTAVSDPDGDTPIIDSVMPRSPAGGNVGSGEHEINYTPPVNFSGIDEVPLTVTDGRGGILQIRLKITVLPEASAPGGADNPPTVTRLPDNTVRVTFHGIPRQSYPLQRSTDLTNWLTIANVTADAAGWIEHIDSSPPADSGYYRLSLP